MPSADVASSTQHTSVVMPQHGIHVANSLPGSKSGKDIATVQPYTITPNYQNQVVHGQHSYQTQSHQALEQTQYETSRSRREAELAMTHSLHTAKKLETSNGVQAQHLDQRGYAAPRQTQVNREKQQRQPDDNLVSQAATPTPQPSTMEEQIRAAVELMRQYQAKDPHLFQTVWENVKNTPVKSQKLVADSVQTATKNNKIATLSNLADTSLRSPDVTSQIAPIASPTQATLIATNNTFQVESPYQYYANTSSYVNNAAPPSKSLPSTVPATSNQSKSPEAETPRTSSSTFPVDQKVALAMVTARFMSRSSGFPISEQHVMQLLDSNPTFVELCVLFEGKGFVFERSKFAHQLLNVVSDNSSRQKSTESDEQRRERFVGPAEDVTTSDKKTESAVNSEPDISSRNRSNVVSRRANSGKDSEIQRVEHIQDALLMASTASAPPKGKPKGRPRKSLSVNGSTTSNGIKANKEEKPKEVRKRMSHKKDALHQIDVDALQTAPKVPRSTPKNTKKMKQDITQTVDVGTPQQTVIPPSGHVKATPDKQDAPIPKVIMLDEMEGVESAESTRNFQPFSNDQTLQNQPSTPITMNPISPQNTTKPPETHGGLSPYRSHEPSRNSVVQQNSMFAENKENGIQPHFNTLGLFSDVARAREYLQNLRNQQGAVDYYKHSNNNGFTQDSINPSELLYERIAEISKDDSLKDTSVARDSISAELLSHSIPRPDESTTPEVNVIAGSSGSTQLHKPASATISLETRNAEVIIIDGPEEETRLGVLAKNLFKNNPELNETIKEPESSSVTPTQNTVASENPARVLSSEAISVDDTVQPTPATSGLPTTVDSTPSKATPAFFSIPKLSATPRWTREQARRTSSYDSKNIAYALLVTTGRHPKEQALNAQFMALKRRLPHIFEEMSDLNQIPWDLIDPAPLSPTPPLDMDGLQSAIGDSNDPIKVDEIVDVDSGLVQVVPRRRGRPLKVKSTAGNLLFRLGTPKGRVDLLKGGKSSGKRSRGSGSQGATTPTGAPRNHTGEINSSPSTPGGDGFIIGNSCATEPSTTQASYSAGTPMVNLSHRTPREMEGSSNRKRKLDAGGKPSQQFKIYKCRWQDCGAELHNFDTLTRHVFRKHKLCADFGGYPCRWAGCFKEVTIGYKAGNGLNKKEVQKQRLDFTSEEDWDTHMLEKHLDNVKHAYGEGPMAGFGMCPSHTSRSSLSFFICNINQLIGFVNPR